MSFKCRPSEVYYKMIALISNSTGSGASLAFLILAAGIFINVAYRALTSSEIPSVIELSEFFFAIGGALGLAYAESKDGHVKSDAAILSLSLRVRSLVQLFAYLIALVWLFYLAILLIWKATSSYSVSELRYGLYSIPYWPVRIAIAVGVVALFFQLTMKVITLIKFSFGRNA